MTTRVRRSVLVSVPGIYGAAILVLFVGDVVLSRTTSPAEFGEYSITRNAIPLIALVAIFGVDQALTREYAAMRGHGVARLVLRSRAMVATGLSALGALLLYRYLGVSVGAALVVAACGPALVISELSAALLRGKGFYAFSALVQQGYRLLLGAAILILATLGQISEYVVDRMFEATVAALLVAVVGFALLGGVRSLKELDPQGTPREAKRMGRLGFAFGLSMISLAAIDWVDQALVTRLGAGLGDTGVYAAHKLIAVYPLLSLASIGGFLLLPELVKSAHILTPRKVLVWLLMTAAIVATVAVAWAAVSPIAYQQFLDREPTWELLATLTAVGGLRLLYVVPSSVLGAVGSLSLIIATALVGLLAIPVLCGTAGALWIAGNEATYSVAYGLLAATAFRLLVACLGAELAVRALKI